MTVFCLHKVILAETRMATASQTNEPEAGPHDLCHYAIFNCHNRKGSGYIGNRQTQRTLLYATLFWILTTRFYYCRVSRYR